MVHCFEHLIILYVILHTIAISRRIYYHQKNIHINIVIWISLQLQITKSVLLGMERGVVGGGFRDKETKGDMRVKKEGENEGRKLKIKDLKEEREERKELKQE